MKQQLIGVVAMLGVAGGAFAQDAVEWRVQDGGNGHWYAVRPKVGDWFLCRAAALANGGDLASPSTAAENAFIEPLVPSAQWPIWNRVFLGGRQAAGSGSNQGWYWVDGSTWTYTDWFWNQPDGGEGFLTHMRDQNDAFWGDYGVDDGDIVFFMLEWSADCNSDGIVDFGQIRDGSLVDTNANNIPDCCEGGPNCAPCAADVVEDGVVNGVDLAAVINAWATDGGKLPRADIDGNGVVDGADLAQVLGAWGPCS